MIYLSASHHPHAKVHVKFNNTWSTVDCLIDTGFSSGIALPVKYLSLINERAKWRQSFELADGSLVELDVYKLSIRYADKTKIVSAIFSQGKDALLGVEFLDGYSLFLDLKNYKVSLS
ncbi:hypothetical protein A2960_06085 [Candidatus Gottesmanbacteria bacterium RIFCSPLOWO2_01_FULL_39_12b]|uniref:Clan AA aspartic protease n=1 Tax=Candidatus Gottesmanbacteria bacterium RIFCSPLOWO2_01_FULL_39_12b TaxID=1798388 RepID=A0A1F6AP07_9BACT|nr:MAG: hypothetical protein A2960_06085 [Candidatus Gottesmanbacteria bacterium RIFCSPLOWO2_01_FULL_39_12b]